MKAIHATLAALALLLLATPGTAHTGMEGCAASDRAGEGWIGICPGSAIGVLETKGVPVGAGDHRVHLLRNWVFSWMGTHAGVFYSASPPIIHVGAMVCTPETQGALLDAKAGPASVYQRAPRSVCAPMLHAGVP